MLTNKKVLVTGGTGFIGGRLIEKLVLYNNANVRALVRNFAHASRIARFDLEMVSGGVGDAEAVDKAVAGCDTVFHCAHDFSSKNANQNVEGTRVLAEACLRHKVRRLVHLSTISVYEPLPKGDLDESGPAEPCGWVYPDNKLAVENLFLKYHKERGLPVVVLQPTIVYGPFAKAWTINPITLLRSYRVALPSEGICNAVYVDDVVDAMLLSAENDKAVGERFLISGPDAVSWHEFYRAYERMLGMQRIVPMASKQLEQAKQISEPTNGLAAHLNVFRHDPIKMLNLAPVRRLYKFTRRQLGEGLRKKMSKAVPAPLYVPEDQMLALYGALATVKIDKARRLLGYNPAYDFKRGMDLTAQYVEWANL